MIKIIAIVKNLEKKKTYQKKLWHVKNTSYFSRFQKGINCKHVQWYFYGNITVNYYFTFTKFLKLKKVKFAVSLVKNTTTPGETITQGEDDMSLTLNLLNIQWKIKWTKSEKKKLRVCSSRGICSQKEKRKKKK